MKLELNKLYNYIYGDWADIEKHIKKDLPPEAKEKAIKKRKQEIIDFFAEKKESLRPIIREQKNSHLEKILFKNNVVKLPPAYQYKNTVSEETINYRFFNLEQIYGLLKDEKGYVSPEAVEMFHIYFNMTKMIGEIYEGDNANDFSAALVHAYKLLVLFGTDPTNCFVKIEKYLDLHNYSNIATKPLHDALTYKLPELNKEKIHLKKWQALLQKGGPKAFKLFNMAPAIEKALGGRCPNDLNEAREVAKNIKFKRAKEAPLLADLFVEYNLDEILFEETLAVEKNKKIKDKLPDIIIDGADISSEYANYHLVKLPIDDPHAYVLGHITNCCQSMGGDSEQCVIDGMTRENNGFYVLLKKIKPAEKKAEVKLDISPVVAGKINYDQYEIVGQSYAWLSQHDNLVFDSWENRTPSQDDKVIAPFLEKFSQAVTQAPNATILRVLIGRGGKTPVKLKGAVTQYPEAMKEGTQYGDSRVQSVIYFNDILVRSLLHDEISYIKSTLADSEIKADAALTIDMFIDFIIESCTSIKQVNTLKPLIADLNYAELKLIFNTEGVKTIPFEACYFLFKADLLTWEVIQDVSIFNKSIEICRAFLEVKMAGFELDEELRESITSNVNPEEKIKKILPILFKLREEKLDHYADVRNHVLKGEVTYNASHFTEALRLLKEANLYSDVSIRKAIEREYFEPRRVAENIIKACAEIKGAGFEINESVRKRISELHRQPNITDYFIRILSLIKKAKFDHYLDVQDMLLSNGRTSETMDYILALTLLREAGLDQYVEIREKILNCHIRNVIYVVNDIIKANSLMDKDKIDPELRIDILVSGYPKSMAEAFLACNITHLEKDLSAFVLKSHSPKDSLKNILLLKEAKLANEVYLCRHVCFSANEKSTKKIISAYQLLQEAKLDNNKNIKSIILSALDPIERAKTFILLQEAKLENDIQIQKIFKSTSLEEINPQKLISALKLLKEANLDGIKYIWSQVIEHHEPERLARAFILLKNAQLEKDDDIMKAISNNYLETPLTIEAIVKAFGILKEAKLDQEADIRSRVLDGIDPVGRAKSILLLKDAKLLDDIQIRNRVCIDGAGGAYVVEIINALELLKMANLNKDEDEDIRTLVIKHKSPEEVAKAFVALREANLKEESDIREIICYEAPTLFSTSRITRLIDAFVLLKNYNISKELKSYILKTSDPDKFAKLVLKLIDAGLESDIALQKSLISKSSSKDRGFIEPLVDTFVILKNANLDNDEKLRSLIFNFNDSNNIFYIGEAILMLHKEALAHDADIRAKVLEKKEGNALFSHKRDIINGFVLLRESKLDHDVDIRNAMLKCSPDNAEETAKECIEVNSLLEKNGINPTLRAQIFAAPKPLVAANEFIKAEKEKLIPSVETLSFFSKSNDAKSKLSANESPQKKM